LNSNSDEDVDAIELAEENLYRQFILPESSIIQVLNLAVFLAASVSSCVAAYQASFQVRLQNQCKRCYFFPLKLANT